MSTIEAEEDYKLLMRATADVKNRSDVLLFAAAVGASSMWDKLTSTGPGLRRCQELVVGACCAFYNFFASPPNPRIADEIRQVLLAGVL